MNTTQNAQTQYVNLSEVDIPKTARAVSPEGQESIQRDLKEKGQLQEIIVAEKPDGRKDLVAGQRRFLGMKALGWQQARARVLPLGTSELDKALITIAENEEREDVSPIDKGLSYQRALDVGGISQEELAKRIGLDKSTTSQYLSLARLPQELRKKFGRPNLGLAHLTEILRLPNEEDQVKLAEEASKEGLTSKEVRGRVKKLLKPAKEERETQGTPPAPFDLTWKDGVLLIKGGYRPGEVGVEEYITALAEAIRDLVAQHGTQEVAVAA